MKVRKVERGKPMNNNKKMPATAGTDKADKEVLQLNDTTKEEESQMLKIAKDFFKLPDYYDPNEVAEETEKERYEQEEE